MATDDTRTQEHARFLREKMKDRGLNAPALARLVIAAGEKVSDDYVRKLARGYSELSTVSLPIREAMRKALRVSAEEWEAETGLTTAADIDPDSPTPRRGPPVPSRLPPVETPLEIPPGLQEAIERYSGVHPEFTVEKNLRVITSIHRYGGGGDFTPEEWLDILMANRRWLVKP